MIEKGYVQMMAHYNAWQNRQITDAVKTMDHAALSKDRGAFFGSILGTLNHLLWGDLSWMSRLCSDIQSPDIPANQSANITPNAAIWKAERFRLDGRILIWAETLRNIDLKGDLTWTSALLGKSFCMPIERCIIHMFNHQTHHRGQVHAMLTAAHGSAPVSDLLLMPEEV